MYKPYHEEIEFTYKFSYSNFSLDFSKTLVFKKVENISKKFILKASLNWKMSMLQIGLQSFLLGRKLYSVAFHAVDKNTRQTILG